MSPLLTERLIFSSSYHASGWTYVTQWRISLEGRAPLKEYGVPGKRMGPRMSRAAQDKDKIWSLLLSSKTDSMVRQDGEINR